MCCLQGELPRYSLDSFTLIGSTATSVKLSVIIPTLNEVKFLRKTVEHTLENALHPERLEIIVVDAGSDDNTLATVQDLPIRVFCDKNFQLRKHKSLNFGLQQSSNDLVIFLDADTLLPRDFDGLILQVMTDKKVVGGAFELQFTHPDVKLFLLSKLNAIRYRLWKTFYGDQAIFCRKDVALDSGGFDDTLMEAAHFCRELKSFGKLKIIAQPVLTSPRRFNEQGFWKVFWFDVKMWTRFVFRLELKKPATSYWKTNLLNG